MTAALKTALREACAEIRRKNSALDWTRLSRIDAWERLADEAELIEAAQEPMVELTDEALATMLGVPVEMVAPEGDCDGKPENIAPDPARRWCVQCDAVVPGGGCCECCARTDGGGTCPNHPPLPAAAPPPGFDRLQASLVSPAHLPGAPPPPSPAIPTRTRPCCARLGSVWCTEPHGHAGECRGAEEREIQGSEFGPTRKRSENVNSSKEQR